MNEEIFHPINAVARRTGLSAHLIRLWERRYQAVTPSRTPTNRRLYTEADIARLSLLHRAVQDGYPIGHVARLSTEAVHDLLVSTPAPLSSPVEARPRRGTISPEDLVEEGVEAVLDLNEEALDSALERASVSHSLPVLLEKVVAPLMERIGDAWLEGHLRVHHEHLASAAIRSFLSRLRLYAAAPSTAPLLISTTPSGQLHEMGALFVALTAATDGWRTMYLGPNLPAEEIAAAARSTDARIVALSLVYPPDNSETRNELLRLRRYLPEETALIVGGRAVDSYGPLWREVRAVHLNTLPEYRRHLEGLRLRPQTPA